MENETIKTTIYMTQLKTTFAGLSLRNPIIISSSSLTNSAEKNKKLELAGAGAIVLKSVFEEQIMMEAHHMATDRKSTRLNSSHSH